MSLVRTLAAVAAAPLHHHHHHYHPFLRIPKQRKALATAK